LEKSRQNYSKKERERERDARGRKKVFSAFLLFYSDVFFFSSVALRRHGGRR
jgi:hypothetical protein